MARWWMAAVLLAGGLGLPAPARAQYLPVEGCPPAEAPAPMPIGPQSPVPPTAACPSSLTQSTLDGDHGNAFGGEDEPNGGACQGFGEGCAGYGVVGGLGLMRQGLPSLPVATTVLDGPARARLSIAARTIVADETSALGVEQMQWGVRAAIGYRWDQCAAEVGGFYLPQASTTQTLTIPAGLNLPFVNFPRAFGDGRFSLTRTDALAQNFQTTLGSAEANFRYQPVAGYGLELLGGVRYLDLQERYTLVDNTTGLSRPPTVATDLFGYTVRTQNRLVGGQFGIDWEHPLWHWLAFGFNAKGAWGVNWLDSQVAFERGDGLRQFGSRTKTQFGQVYEAGLFLDWYPCARARVRGGYNVLWAVDVAEALGQVSSNLAQAVGRPSDNGSVFYHGPVIELHFLF